MSVFYLRWHHDIGRHAGRRPRTATGAPVRHRDPGAPFPELADRRKAALPAGLTSSAGIYVAAAGGGVVLDVDGNSFIDLGSGIAVTTVGNAAPAVVSRAAAQLAQYTHTCFLATPYEPYIAVAEALNRLTPGDHEKRTALFNTGSEALENAVKYARAATGRPAVVVFDHAFHGRSLLTMTMTAKNQPYKHGFGPFAPEVYRAPMAYPLPLAVRPRHTAPTRRSASSPNSSTPSSAPTRSRASSSNPSRVRAASSCPPTASCVRIADFCRDRGILLVADEVQTGIARTGAWFASEHEGIVPDLITTAKGLAGGLPLAAVTGRADIMDAAHAGRYRRHLQRQPRRMRRRARGVRRDRERSAARPRGAIGDLMVRELRDIAASTDVVGEIRGPRRDDRRRTGDSGYPRTQPRRRCSGRPGTATTTAY